MQPTPGDVTEEGDALEEVDKPLVVLAHSGRVRTLPLNLARGECSERYSGERGIFPSLPISSLNARCVYELCASALCSTHCS